MKFFFITFLLISGMSSAQSLTIVNSSNVRVQYDVGVAELNCAHSVSLSGLLINAYTIELERITFMDFGSQIWLDNSFQVSPAYCDSNYGLPDFSIVKFKYLGPRGNILADGYVTLNNPDNCIPDQTSWSNRFFSVTMVRDFQGNIVVEFN